MRKHILLSIFTIFALLGLLTSAGAVDTPTKVRKAPNLTFTDVKNQKYALSSLRGKVVILDLWATWCGPCRKEIPSFIKLQKKYGDKLVIIGISYDSAQNVLDKFMKTDPVGREINYPIVFSASQKESLDEPEAIPTTYVIDKKGNIRDLQVGTAPFEKFDKLVEQLLAES